MPNWKIPGQKQSPAAEPAGLQPGRFKSEVSVETTDLIRVGLTRAGEKPALLEDVADDDLLEIELEGGVKQWILAEQFRKDFLEGAYGTRGAATADPSGDLEIDPYLRLGGPTRGGSRWILKGVRRLAVKLAKGLLDEVDAPGVAASVLCGTLEKKFMPDPGFKRWGGGDNLTPADASDMDDKEPNLVFLHGTFSSTGGSFGDLSLDGEVWKGLTNRYGTRIFALDHYTMGHGPIENALAAVRNLKPNARIHLVSHSRGGMIGELLCRGQRTEGNPFDDIDLKAILGDPDDEQMAYRQEQQEQLRELDALLREKTPRIERFVRVAAPAAGTSLASERLDRWLSILLNAMKLVPALAVSPTYELVSSFTAAVLKKRLDPGRFPGIEAMRPTSPLVRVLNRPDVKTAADLTVIAGDLEGSGLWGSVKQWVIDLVYLSDNDIVVNTPSMYGGAQRSGGVYFFDHGPKVDHFRYFSNPRTAKKITQGLNSDAGDDEQLFEQRKDYGFLDLETKRKLLREKQDRLGKALVRGQRDATKKPVVFVLPGIMGSELHAGKSKVWVNPVRLALGGMGRLRIDADLVRATELLAGPYGDIIEHLSVEHAVKAFPYDWRRSISAEARRLALDVRKALNESPHPVRILAHSLGGLLARTMFAQDEELWKLFRERKDCRLIMLGTPNAGSFAIARVLLGRDKMLRLLSLVDLSNNRREMVDIVSRFPGILELLPDHLENRDSLDEYFQGATWKKLAGAVNRTWPAPNGSDLSRARDVRKLLRETAPDPDRMLYVAGRANETPAGVEIDSRGHLRFLATREGDGSVPWKGGVPDGFTPWYMDAEHGKMADHKPAFTAIDELLTTGETKLLSRTRPAVARDGETEFFELTEETIEAYPDELELQAAAVGYSFVHEEDHKIEPVALSVFHGNVAFVSCPVLAGHHDGDMIFGAEAALDHKLDGRLTERRNLGLYAGKIGSSEVVLKELPEDCDPNHRVGAVIVGLGPIGRLLPSGLEASVANGALRFAIQLAEEQKQRLGGTPSGHPQKAKLCSLVIGSEFGGLSVAESIGAILKGVLRANDLLAEQKMDAWVRIGELQFIELYQDRAIQAAQLLLRLRDEESLKLRIEVKPELIRGDSGRSRVPLNRDAEWWHRVQIAEHCRPGSLSFTTMTGRARADVDVLPMQLENVRRFVDVAVTRPTWNDQVANTLFHLLLPNALKPMALEERNLVLVLGPEAAVYPWELLHDRTSGATKPLATRTGLIRQLASEQRGRQPVDALLQSALVVGNPPTHLPNLPGAEHEANEVRDQLRAANLDVTASIASTADEIQMALFAKPYQILHLAGHGEIDPDLSSGEVHQPNSKTGMVIGDHLYLTPAVVSQLPAIPELVFINCCHLGATGPEGNHKFNLLAANLGAQFIRDGVSAVVAAGWAVDDAAALTFAREFYRRMLGGEQFGEAVKCARALTYALHPRVNTFGAYQCYGDPTYKLRLATHLRSGGGTPSDYVSPEHAALGFDEIRHRAKVLEVGSLERLRDEADQLAKRLRREHSGWIDSSAGLNAAMGDAFRELEIYSEAVEAYDRALRSKGENPRDSDASVRILEQRGNAKTRLKVKGETAVQAVARIQDGLKDMEIALAIGETAERHSLVGGAYRRLYFTRARKAAADLDKAAQHYRAAYSLKLAHNHLDAAYPLTNWLSIGLGLHPAAEARNAVTLAGKKLDYGEALDEAAKNAREKTKLDPDFWAWVMPIDCRLLRSIYDGDLPEKAEAIAAEYNKLLTGSPSQRASVAHGIEAHQRMLKLQAKGDAKAKQDKLIKAVETILNAVKAKA